MNQEEEKLADRIKWDNQKADITLFSSYCIFYKKNVQNLVSKQIFAKWQSILLVFYFEIEFIKGTSNVLHDFLS